MDLAKPHKITSENHSNWKTNREIDNFFQETRKICWLIRNRDGTLSAGERILYGDGVLFDHITIAAKLIHVRCRC